MTRGSSARAKKTAMIVNRSAPTATIVPILIYEDVNQAIDFLCSAFGFTERLRAPGPNGVVSHAQLVVGEGSIMLGRRGGPYQPPNPDAVAQYVHVHVDDVDAHFEHAQQHGARIVRPPADMPFGERQYIAADREGHWWSFSQHVKDVAPEEWGAVTARAK
jgi:uncharacterized glyoxalase superfamily protein PhnB